MSQTWDCVIAGAGPAGCAAGLVLARAGARVLIIAPEQDPLVHGPGEALPGAARPLLQSLGLLGLVARAPHLPCYGTVSVWGAPLPHATDAIADPHGPGWHLDRPRFDADLLAAARDAGASYRIGRVTAAQRSGPGWQIAIGDAVVLGTWLIDASGRRACATRLALASRTRDDRLVALYAWARWEAAGAGADSRTLVEAAPYGWWYLSPLPAGRCLVALHVDAEEAATMRRTPGSWQNRLAATRHIAARLGGTRFPHGPRATEACGAWLDPCCGPGWVAVGDAALSFDPLSAQGIFTALYTGMRGAEAVAAGLMGQAGTAGRGGAGVGLSLHAGNSDGDRRVHGQAGFPAVAGSGRGGRDGDGRDGGRVGGDGDESDGDGGRGGRDRDEGGYGEHYRPTHSAEGAADLDRDRGDRQLATSRTSPALQAYAARLQAIRAAYLVHHAAFYRLEGRWSEQPFWRKRHGPTA